MYEIYWNSNNDMLVCEDQSTGNFTRFDHLKRSFIYQLDKNIQALYPDTYDLLCQALGGAEAKAYARVYQFCACNFGTKDGVPDIDDDWNFRIEHVACPVRHTCKYRFCNPVIISDLSKREKEILPLFVQGLDDTEIGERLFISKHTVHNHINNIYAKLGFVGRRNPDRLLINYAYKNQLV
jgi:hypothetical protein